MKTFHKSITSLLLIGICVCSVQAQNASPQVWTLKQCIDYAIEHNISILQAANTVEQNKVEVNTSKWSRLPNLNGYANQDWGWGRIPSLADGSLGGNRNTSNSSLGLTTNAPIFTGMQLPNQYALAKLNLKAVIEDLNKAKEDIAINITSVYLQVLFDMELNTIAQNQVVLSKEQLKRINGLYEVGKTSPSEVAEAQARVAQDEMNAIQTDNNYKLALLDLSQLLELPTPEGFVIESPKEELILTALTPPDDIYTQALTYKPNIKAAEYRLEGSEKNIRIAQSAYYPQLSFSAGLGTSYFTENSDLKSSFHTQIKDNFKQNISFNLSIPLFNRFATRNRVRTARLQQTYLTLQLDNTKKALYKEIQQAWYSAVAAESKYNTSEVAVKANEASFKLMNEKFNNGKATFVEYSEAKQNLTKALSDKLQAKYDYLFRSKILDFYKGQPIE